MANDDPTLLLLPEPTLDTVFRAHYQRIARVTGCIVTDQARAEELAVEVILKWKAGYSEGWLYRSAARLALDELRRQSRKQRVYALLAAVRLRTAPDPAELLSANTQQTQVRAVLSSLPSRQAEILLLWSEDVAYRDIASALAVRENYVGSLLSRAQLAFRKEYQKRYGSPE